MACGPSFGDVVGTVQFKDDSKVQWLNILEVEGMPNLYLTDKDVYDGLIADDPDNEEFIDYMCEHTLNEFDGIEFYGDYENVFDSIAEDPENPAIPLVRYLIALVRCEMADVEKLVQMASGKYADELAIPVSDVEEDEDRDDQEDL